MSERVYESLICPSCGCLCDDIDVVVEGNRIKTIRNVCDWGVNKFFFTKKFTSNVKRGRVESPMVKEENLAETDYKTAISMAAKILGRAEKPLVYGLNNSGYNAQKIALDIARRLKGWFEPGRAALYSPYYSAMKDSCFYTAPLEEVKNSADLLIYWGCNPIHSTPRHLARYSMFPRGRIKERGSLDRKVINIDVAENEMNKISGQSLQVKPGTDNLVMEAMTKLLKGESAEDDAVDIPVLMDIVKLINMTSYGAIFFGLGLSKGGNVVKNIESLMALVKELNRKRKFMILPLYDDFNTNGAMQLLLRELGSAMPVDFSSDLDGNRNKHTLLENLHEVDAALIVGEDPFWSLPSEKSDLLKDIPMVLIDPFWTRTTTKCRVVFPAAVTGVEAEGIAYRMDGLPLHLKKVLESEYKSDEVILRDLRRCLG